MVLPNSTALADAGQPLSGLRLILLENTPLSPAEQKEISAALSPAVITPLHRQLAAICLHNPYWNNFFLLNHFQKRGLQITLEDIHRLKKECGLDDREAICNTLFRLSSSGGLKLNNRQISYIERTKPEFRDRDLLPSQPGELLVYKLLLGRGRLFELGTGDFGRVYIHLFVDLYTRYVFAQLDQERTLAAGLRFLNENIFPAYQANHHDLQTVMHSTQSTGDIKEFDDMENTSTFSRLGLQWMPTRRKFGVIEKFERNIGESSFDTIPLTTADRFQSLQASFKQWLTRYNSSNRLLARRSILEY